MERSNQLLNIVPKQKLREGYEISRIIKGGWQLAGDHGRVHKNRAVQDMITFVDAGITTFDCADIYLGVEQLIGKFLAELRRQRGEQSVKKVKIHTKYVPDRDSLTSLSFKDVEQIIDRSLCRLGQDRLEMVQFHWWDYSVPGHVEAISHLETLRRKGKVNLIGATNFDSSYLRELGAEVDLASVQVQYSLLDSRASGDFARIAAEQNISLLVYGVLAGGFLTDRWIGKIDPGFMFENRSLVKYRLIIEDCGGWKLFQELLVTLRKIADQHKVDVATIAIRAILEDSKVAAIILGARYANRIPQTLKVFDISLTDEDKLMLEAIRKRQTPVRGNVYELERDTNGRHGKIMKYNLNKGDNSQFRDTKT